MPAEKPSRRRPITVTQRIALRRHAQHHPSLSQGQLCTWFEEKFGHRPSQGTISESLSTRFQHLDNQLNVLEPQKTKTRACQWPELEEALFEWHQRIESEVPISGDLIKAIATRLWGCLDVYKEMEVPQFSNGWVDKFKRRHGIRQRIRHGESGSVNEALSTEQLLALQAIIAQYCPTDVYNCDESALFWKAVPERGLSSQPVAGKKQEKARITAHFCCNADGSDKLPIWFIGKAKNPRAFGPNGINFSSCSCIWRFNGKAWMNTQIMLQWLKWFDQRIIDQNPQRKVLLLMDNFSAHIAAVDALTLAQQPLKNTIIYWLPPNTTSKFQPLDQGIIRTWKAYYRRSWLFYMCEQFEHNKNPIKTVNVLKAIQWSIRAWEAVKPATITNCWQHSTLLSGAPRLEENQEQPDVVVTEVGQLIQRLQIQNRIQQAMSITSFLNPEDEVVQDHPFDDLIEEVASQFNTAEEEVVEEEEEEEEEEPPPLVTIIGALEALQQLRLFEQQQLNGNNQLIRQLDHHETLLFQRRFIRLQQAPITSFFTTSR